MCQQCPWLFCSHLLAGSRELGWEWLLGGRSSPVRLQNILAFVKFLSLFLPRPQPCEVVIFHNEYSAISALMFKTKGWLLCCPQPVLLVGGRSPRFVVSFEPRLLLAVAQPCLPWPFAALLGGEKPVRYRADVWSSSVSGYKEAYEGSACLCFTTRRSRGEGSCRTRSSGLRWVGRAGAETAVRGRRVCFLKLPRLS